MIEYVTLNGEPADHRLVDARALNYGDGLFETIRCVDSGIPLITFHEARLHKAAQILGYDLPTKWLEKTLNNAGLSGRCGFKVLLSRAFSGRSYRGSSSDFDVIVRRFELPERNDRVSLTVAEHRLPVRRINHGLKSVSALDYVLANRCSTGGEDVLILDERDCVIETSRANLIFQFGSELVTPDLAHSGVHGVFLAALKDQGFDIKTRDVRFDELERASAVVAINALMGPVTVSAIGSLTFGSTGVSEIFEWARANGF